MSLIKFDNLSTTLKEHRKKGNIPWFYLIFGDSFLLKDALKSLLGFLQEKAKDEFSYETLDGSSVTIGELIEQVSTFSFFSPQKIVLLKNAALFQSKSQSKNQTKTSTEGSGISPADLDILTSFLEKGKVPPNHFLIIMCPLVDRKRKAYKIMEKSGLIIDCSVSQGLRKADIDEQARVFKSVADKILSASKKKIGRQAFQTLSDLTGADLELFSQNLEKLIIYVGTNKEITVKDVHSVITKDKKEPVFKLSNAFMEKDMAQALALLNSLFADGAHPLQILKILENQIRKVLLVKEFTEKSRKESKGLNFKAINFNMFKQNILPKITEQDKKTKKAFEEKELAFTGEKPKKKTGSSELLLAANPNNPYPVFLLFQKSENFSYKEIQQALIELSDMEYRLKSSLFDAQTAFESFIITFCKQR